MEIRDALSAWDGKSVDYLRELYDRYRATPKKLVAEVIESVSVVELQVAATWLLKHAADQDCAYISHESARILQQLPHLRKWEAQLHILQLLHCLSITEAERLTVESFIRDCFTSRNKFVLAWAYNGIGLLASAFPQYASERDRRYEYGLEHEAPSIRARIRQAQKKESTRH